MMTAAASWRLVGLSTISCRTSSAMWPVATTSTAAVARARSLITKLAFVDVDTAPERPVSCLLGYVSVITPPHQRNLRARTCTAFNRARGALLAVGVVVALVGGNDEQPANDHPRPARSISRPVLLLSG